MAQCDGCDEWYHSACMGIRQLQRPKGPKAAVVPAFAGAAVEEVVGDEGTEVDAPGGAVAGGAAAAAAAGAKKAGKGGAKGRAAKGAAVRTSRQLSATVSEAFFCIPCCEQRQAPYPFQW